MGVKERRIRQKENLRQEILNAARRLFAKDGYENVSMRKIAEKIEYSPTTIYLYFEDKAELFFHLCEETFAQLLKRLEAQHQEAVNNGGTDPLTCLKNGLRTYIDFGLKHPNHYKIVFINRPEHYERPELYFSEVSTGMKTYNYLRQMVEECVKQKKFREIDVEAACQALWAATHGLTSLFITDPEFPWIDKDKLIDITIDTMIAGLKT
jgi:AcrR family transcriptional regulator